MWGPININFHTGRRNTMMHTCSMDKKLQTCIILIHTYSRFLRPYMWGLNSVLITSGLLLINFQKTCVQRE